MLVLKDICWRVPEKEILDSVSLTVPDGKCVVVTGPNGGGKTSLAKIIAGIEQPDSGKLLLDGRIINRIERDRAGAERDRLCFPAAGALQGPDGAATWWSLAAGKELWPRASCADMLTEVGLCAREYIDRDVNASLSGGEIKRIEIATVLARGAKLTWCSTSPRRASTCGASTI